VASAGKPASSPVGGLMAAARPRAGGRRLRRAGAPYLYVVPALLFLLAVELYPIAYNVRNSLVGLDIGTYLSGDAPWVGLDNYQRVIDDPAFQHAVGVSLIFTAACIALQFSIGLALALFFVKPFPGSTTLRALLVLGWLLPGVVTGNLFRWMFDGDSGVVMWLISAVGLGDHAWLVDPQAALWAAIVTNVWVGIPFNMLLLLPALQAIPQGLYEAAEVDGASAWQRFRHITLPLLRPAALSVVLLGVIYTFKVFDLIYVLTGGGPVDATTVLPIYIFDLSLEFFRFGEGAAASTLLLLAMLVVAAGYLWLARREESA
jgi:multiple sugar transport system permease protein